MDEQERTERRRALLRGLGHTLVLGVPILLMNLDTTTVALAAFFGAFLAAYGNARPMVMPVALGGLLGLLVIGLLLSLLDGPYDGMGFLLLIGFAASLVGAVTGERAGIKS